MPAYVDVSTDHLSAQDAYDFWREDVLSGFDADPLPRDERNDFRARARALVSERASFLVHHASHLCGGRTSSRARPAGDDHFTIGLVLSGTRFQQLGCGAATMARRGQWFVFDSAIASRIDWKDSGTINLTLPHAAIDGLFCGRAPSPDRLGMALTDSGFAPFLRSQFLLLARHMDRLGDSERACLLDHTADLVLSALENIGAATRQPPEASRRGLFAAALNFIDMHLTDEDLNAARVASALGCSRATLYRAFAEQGQAVARRIRDQRLERVVSLMASSPACQTIGALAHASGFHDLPNFNRVFRTRYGMRPSEMRELLANN